MMEHGAGGADGLCSSSDSGCSPRITRNKKIDQVSKTCRQMSDLSSSASDDYSSQGGSQEVVARGDPKRRKSFNGMAKPSSAGVKPRTQQGKTNGNENSSTNPRAKTASASLRNGSSTNGTRPWKSGGPIHKGDVETNGGSSGHPSEKPKPPWNSTMVPKSSIPSQNPVRSARLPRSNSVNQVSIPLVGTGRARVNNATPQPTNLVQHRNLQNNLMNQQHPSGSGNSSTVTTLVLENTRLKEKVSAMGHIVSELQVKIDTLSSSPSLFKKLKLYVDDIAPERPDSKAIVSQYLDLQLEEVSQSRRQMSDLSSGSDYSTSTGSQGEVAARRSPPPLTKATTASLNRTRLGTSRNNLANGPSSSRPSSQQGSRVPPVVRTTTTALNNRYKSTTKVQQNGSSGSGSVGAHQRVAEVGSTRPPLSTVRNPTAASVAKLQHNSQLSSGNNPLRDRNRLGPLGKASSVDGTVNGTPNGVSLNGRYQPGPGGRHPYEGMTMPAKNGRSNSVNTVCIPHGGSAHGERLIESSASLHNNNNQMVHRNLQNNNSHNQTQNAVLVENTHLKEQVHGLGNQVYELQERLDLFSALPAQLKFHSDQLHHSNAAFDSMSVVVQYLDLQKNALLEKLKKLREGILVKEQELANERLKEVQALRLEFARERECTKEELNSLLKKHEFEMREQACNYEENISDLNQQHSDFVSSLKETHKREISHLEAKHRNNVDSLKQKHTDQMISYTKSTPCEVLHKEIHSLQVVIEIRNQEIKDLRKEVLTFKELAERLSDVKDENHALLAKVEDLEAQLEKTRTDRSSLMDQCALMQQSITTVVSQNDTLHLQNEELNWRIASLKSSGDFTESTSSPSVGSSMTKSGFELGSSSGVFSDTE